MRRISRKLGIMVLGLCLGVAGCATGYQKVGLTGGYSNMKIQDNIFKVQFRGNAYTSREKTEDFALLRCAEVALENGYRYFVVLEEKSSSKKGAYTTPVQANTYGTVNVYGNSGSYHQNTTVTGGQTHFFSKPSTQTTIQCFKEKPENIPVIVYDAEQVKTNTKEHYGIK